MSSTSLSPCAHRIPAVFLRAVLALAVCPACFRGADISKIVCSETKYCPGGYVCVVPPGKTQGSCARPRDAGGSTEANASLDGAVGLDGAIGIDGPRAVDGAALDLSEGGVDQALANPDGSPTDTSIGVDLPLADLPAESPKPLPDSSVADAPADHPMVADAPEDLPMVADTPTDLRGIDAPLKVTGVTCQKGSECASTYCVDGVCCDGPCTGQCQACAEANKLGTCSTVSGVPRGARAACAATQATCAGACAGSLPSQCSYPSSETTCTGASCSSDLTLKTASVCNGAGACTASSVVSCDLGKYCTGSACVAQIANGGTCQNSNQCTSGNCSNSLCCAAGQTACGGSCVSISSSNANCGTCGRPCAAGSSCAGGSCYLADGQSCTTGSQCLSGVCSTFYLDSDGDGYGVGVGISQCGTTPPTGYAKNSGDCCDSDPNAKPGQTAYFTAADACGSFDYNCDSQETPQSNGPTNCGTPSCDATCTLPVGCTCAGDSPCTTFGTAACGQPYYLSVKFCHDMGGSCSLGGNGVVGGNQACN